MCSSDLCDRFGFQMIHNRSDRITARPPTGGCANTGKARCTALGLFVSRPRPHLARANRQRLPKDRARKAGCRLSGASIMRLVCVRKMIALGARRFRATPMNAGNEMVFCRFWRRKLISPRTGLKKWPRIRLAKPSLPLFSPRGSAPVKPAAMRPFGKGLDGCA